ncbi:amidohydrolase family protein, partial [Mycobacterium avium]
ALSSSAAALPSLLAFARPGHITFGSDWPFAPVAVGKLFAAGLETYPALDTSTRGAIEHTNALALFPRLGTPPHPIPRSLPAFRITRCCSGFRNDPGVTAMG